MLSFSETSLGFFARLRMTICLQAGRPRSGKKNGGRSPRVKSCDKRLKYIVVVELFESLVTVFEVSLEHSVKFRSFVREEFSE